MASPEQQLTTLQIVLNFVRDSWPMVGGIVAVWKTIEEVAKYYSKKQDARLRELIKDEVTPQIDNLTHAINELRETIGTIKNGK